MNDDPGSSSATVDVTILDPKWTDALADPKTLVCRAVAATLVEASQEPSRPTSIEVSVVLADDARVRQLNSRFRRKNEPTNVLSFPGPDMPVAAPVSREHLLGDVILARETVLCEAAEQGKSADHHMTHLIVHGVLHLLGHDHMNAEEAEEMERLETMILASLGLPDPYAPGSGAPNSSLASGGVR